MPSLQIKILSDMKKKAVTEKKFGCEFCNREFLRESTIMNHLCETKRRWNDRDKHANRLGFQSWLQFYTKNSNSKKKREYLDFAKSPYYIAFVKYGNYCINANVLNVPRFTDWLLKEQIRLDTWAQDTVYNKFLVEYLRKEDAMDAVERSIVTTIELAEKDNIQARDCLRYGNRNRICHTVANGRISPWVLYHSESGIKFLESLDETQQKMILEYINPEQWAIKFKRDKDIVKEVKDLLNAAGY